MPPTPDQLAKAGTEAAHQTALFCWAALPSQKEKYPELEMMFHIPNGGTRNKIEAGHLKAQGVKAGVPDICLPVPRGRFHGLWIEMKLGNNKPSDHQERWMNKLWIQGYYVQVCYSWMQAVQNLVYYLELGK